MSEIQSVTLHCTEGGADKLYRLQIDAQDTHFVLSGFNGRRGNALAHQPKGEFSTLEAAQKEFTKLLNSKTKKGYVAIGDSPSMALPGVKERIDTMLRPQLLNALELDELDRFLDSPAYGMSEKHDGVRFMVTVVDGKALAANRTGGAKPIPLELERAITALRADCTLDGELVGQTYFVFDLLMLEGEDLRPLSFQRRFQALEHLLIGTQEPLALVPVITETAQKRACFEELQARKAEGCVFKDLAAPHSAGRPNSGGPQRKFKFTEDASFIVGRHNAQRSVGLQVFTDDGQLLDVGNVTIPPNYAVPPLGAIVDVAYLYKFKGGCIYQPVYKGERPDVLAEECLERRLKLKAETAA